MANSLAMLHELKRSRHIIQIWDDLKGGQLYFLYDSLIHFTVTLEKGMWTLRLKSSYTEEITITYLVDLALTPLS